MHMHMPCKHGCRTGRQSPSAFSVPVISPVVAGSLLQPGGGGGAWGFALGAAGDAPQLSRRLMPDLAMQGPNHCNNKRYCAQQRPQRSPACAQASHLVPRLLPVTLPLPMSVWWSVMISLPLSGSPV